MEPMLKLQSLYLWSQFPFILHLYFMKTVLFFFFEMFPVWCTVSCNQRNIPRDKTIFFSHTVQSLVVFYNTVRTTVPCSKLQILTVSQYATLWNKTQY